MNNPRKLGGEVASAVENSAWAVCAAVGVVLAVLVSAVTSRYGFAAGALTLAGGAVAASAVGRHCGRLITKCDVRHIHRC